MPANGSRDMFTALVRSRNVSHDRVRVQRVAQGTEREADEMSIRPVEREPWAEVRYTEYTGRAANAPKHNASHERPAPAEVAAAAQTKAGR